MINELDKTIENLLKAALPSELAHQLTFSFSTPDEDFSKEVTRPAVDLFLYDLRENYELRSNEWIITKNLDGSVTQKRPPLRLDCSYMITVWTGTVDESDASEEHRILGEIVKVLFRYKRFPDPVKMPSMKNAEIEASTQALHPGHLQSIGEFWQALGGQPKATLNYTVTLAVDTDEAEEAGRMVIDKKLKFKEDS